MIDKAKIIKTPDACDVEDLYHKHFADTCELIQFANQDSLYSLGYSSRRVYSKNEKPWAGTHTYQDAVGLAEKGWHDRPDLGSIAGTIEASSDRNIERTEYAVSGSWVDVGQYMTGNPECMVQFAEAPVPKVFKLAVNVWHNCRVNSFTFQLIGAVALAVCDAVAKSGNAIEIVGIGGGHDRGIGPGYAPPFIYSFGIKDSDRLLDEDKLSFWVCHNSVLRRFFFAVLEAETNDDDPLNFNRLTASGYSTPWNNDKKGNDLMREFGRETLKADYTITGGPQTVADAVKLYNEIMATLDAK